MAGELVSQVRISTIGVGSRGKVLVRAIKKYYIKITKNMKEIYITTAIPYVNAAPHAGFALELIETDVIARYHRILGNDVFFLTGSDENSLKNVQAAKEEGISTKELVDRNSKEFKNLKEVLNISFNDFIRTTEKRHIEGAQKLWQACKKDIYKKKYQGLYCVGCEQFYKEDELENGLCPEHKTKPELIEEENYFFKLTNYQDKLKKLIEKDELKIIPETRKNEVLSFINSGLEDFCISRSAKRAQGWGVEVPGDALQILWVWQDALSNYLNALGYAENDKLFKKYWQDNENILHVIGKGILRFHAVYWPAILLSAGLNLPKEIFVHGYFTIDGQKISKSLGNIIGPKELVEKFGIDGTRYLLISSLPYGKDGDISWEKLTEKYNADLANGFGNLVSRVITLNQKLAPHRTGGSGVGSNLKSQILDIKNKKHKPKIKKLDKLFQEFKLKEVLDEIWKYINLADKLVEEKKLWVLVKSNSKEAEKYLKELLGLISEIGEVLAPFMPETSEKISQILKTGKSQILFPRAS